MLSAAARPWASAPASAGGSPAGSASAPAVFDREQHTLTLPAVNSISYVLRFLEKLCHSLRSDNLFGSQPCSHLCHMQRPHPYGHDRYLPGRSWGGGLAGTPAAPSPAAVLTWGGSLSPEPCLQGAWHRPGALPCRTPVLCLLPVALVSISACRSLLIPAVSLSSLLSLSPSPSCFLQFHCGDLTQSAIQVQACLRGRGVLRCSRSAVSSSGTPAPQRGFCHASVASPAPPAPRESPACLGGATLQPAQPRWLCSWHGFPPSPVLKQHSPGKIVPAMEQIPRLQNCSCRARGPAACPALLGSGSSP